MCEMLMALNIGILLSWWTALEAMQGPVRAPGFSKTARSGPGHGEASWDCQRARVEAVRDRCLVDDFMKGPAESAEAREPDVEADVRHAAVGFAQQEHRALDPPALKISMRSLVKGRAERSN